MVGNKIAGIIFWSALGLFAVIGIWNATRKGRTIGQIIADILNSLF